MSALVYTNVDVPLYGIGERRIARHFWAAFEKVNTIEHITKRHQNKERKRESGWELVCRLRLSFTIHRPSCVVMSSLGFFILNKLISNKLCECFKNYFEPSSNNSIFLIQNDLFPKLNAWKGKSNTPLIDSVDVKFWKEKPTWPPCDNNNTEFVIWGRKNMQNKEKRS